MELLEQETAKKNTTSKETKEKITSKGMLFKSHEEADDYLKKQFEGIIQSEVEKLISYLNSELALQRFNADTLNTGKNRNDVKTKIIDSLRKIEFHTVDSDDLYTMQYQFIYNEITLNVAGCKALEYDSTGKLKKITHRYSEAEMRLILYHELLHATSLYTKLEDNILLTLFPLEELQNNIKNNSDIVSGERYISNYIEIYPRLKIIQNFLVKKNIELTAENLYDYFFKLSELWNKGPTQELKNYFSEPLDDDHKRLIYETFIIGLNMNFEEKEKSSQIKKLNWLVTLLEGLVSVGDDNNIMISTA